MDHLEQEVHRGLECLVFLEEGHLEDSLFRPVDAVYVLDLPNRPSLWVDLFSVELAVSALQEVLAFSL